MKTVHAVAVLAALAAAPALAQQSLDQSSPSGGQSLEQRSDSSSLQQVDDRTVRDVQQRLKDQGYFDGEVNGLFDSRTQQALSEFQQDQNVGSTGRIDPETLAALGVERSDTQQAQTPEDQGATTGQPGEIERLRTQEGASSPTVRGDKNPQNPIGIPRSPGSEE